MKDLTNLTNEQLIAKFQSGYAYYKTWENSQDGSDGACWADYVAPCIAEMEKRGLNWVEYK